MRVDPINQSTKSALLVLGMHRSGTSALTRMLSLLGCTLPNTLMGASKGNETGHWESHRICELDDKILYSVGSRWDDWLEFEPAWFDSEAAMQVLEEAVGALEGEFGSSSLFVLKDPRICRLAKFWLRAIEALGANPYILLPIRNPLEVATSLAKRNGMEPSISYLIWLRHVLDAEYATRGRPRFFLSYDLLMKDWRKVVDKMQEMFDLNFLNSSEIAAEIEGFLSSNLRHEEINRAEIFDNHAISPWFRDGFAIFESWTEGGERETDFSALDSIRKAFNAAAPAFGRPLAVARRAVNLSRRQEQQLDAARNRIDDLEKKNIELTDLAALTQSRDEIQQQAVELAAVKGELRDLTLAYEKREALVADYLTQIEALLAAERRSYETIEAMRSHASRQLKAKAQELNIARQEVLGYKARAKALELQGMLEAQTAIAERRALKATVDKYLAEIGDLTVRIAGQRAAAEQFKKAIAVLVNIDNLLSASFLGRVPSWRKVQIRHMAAKLIRYELFDREWYLSSNADVRDAGVDAVEHYILCGAKEGRAPSAIFER